MKISNNEGEIKAQKIKEILWALFFGLHWLLPIFMLGILNWEALDTLATSNVWALLVISLAKLHAFVVVLPIQMVVFITLFNKFEGTPSEKKVYNILTIIALISFCINVTFVIYSHTYGNFIIIKESMMEFISMAEQFLMNNFLAITGVLGGAFALLAHFIRHKKAGRFGIPAKMLHMTTKDISSVLTSLFVVVGLGSVAPFIIAINFERAIDLFLILFLITLSTGFVVVKIVLTIISPMKETKCKTILSFLGVVVLIIFFWVIGAYHNIITAFVENRLLDYSDRFQTIEVFMQIPDWTIWAILIHMVLLLTIEALVINSSILGEPTYLLGSKSMCMIVRRKNINYLLLGKHDHDQWIFMKCEVCTDKILVHKENFAIDKLTFEDKVEVVWRKNIDTI